MVCLFRVFKDYSPQRHTGHREIYFVAALRQSFGFVQIVMSSCGKAKVFLFILNVQRLIQWPVSPGH
jgi:hypothetical protein